MRFLIRVAVVFVIVMAAISALRGMFKPSSPQRSPAGGPPPPSKAGKLIKDPVCGTYVSQDQSLTMTRGSETFHFCSEECHDKFLATETYEEVPHDE